MVLGFGWLVVLVFYLVLIKGCFKMISDTWLFCLFFKEGRNSGVFETALRILAAQKCAMHQNDREPLHQNVIQPNANKSIKTNKSPAFYWWKVIRASVYAGPL